MNTAGDELRAINASTKRNSTSPCAQDEHVKSEAPLARNAREYARRPCVKPACLHQSVFKQVLLSWDGRAVAQD